jgi:hypothetical protein
MDDIAGLAIWGLVAGLVASVVVHFNVRGAHRARVMQWCLTLGAISVVLVGVVAAVGGSAVLTRGALGAGYVGLPALVLGVFLWASRNTKRQMGSERGPDV